MGNFALKQEIVNAIKIRATVIEGRNLQKPQGKRSQTLDMLNRQIEMIKTELAGEKENLS